ncbi:hypothetical protein [Aestuariimicrobium ganziense]|uniref:hypothetical protein n=1 Tax=Aestuariimicrobium ganziense TaxID=2773677 RepID=UPI001940A706|nr:hypothetical protein [Aestuariimicrobium ganziense]
MIPVGLPVWVSESSGPTPVSKNVTEQGITISMVAVRSQVTVDFGDGTVIRCTAMSTRPAGADPSLESPDCGHTYTAVGDYTVTTTGHWTVTWHAAGQSGTVELNAAQRLPVEIGEVSSVLVPSR